MAENTDKISDKRLKNLKPPYKKGQSGNPKGHPLGQKNYATLYKEAIIKLAKLNNKEPNELELEIISKGIINARAGEFNFYKDVLDRLHGKAQEKIEHSGAIETIIRPIQYGDIKPINKDNISSTILLQTTEEKK